MGGSLHLALEVLGDHPGQLSEPDTRFWFSSLYAKSPGALQAQNQLVFFLFLFQNQLVKWWQSKDLPSSLGKGGWNGKSSSLKEKGKPFLSQLLDSVWGLGFFYKGYWDGQDMWQREWKVRGKQALSISSLPPGESWHREAEKAYLTHCEQTSGYRETNKPGCLVNTTV